MLLFLVSSIQQFGSIEIRRHYMTAKTLTDSWQPIGFVSSIPSISLLASAYYRSYYSY